MASGSTYCFGQGLPSSSGFEDDSEPENTYAPQRQPQDPDIPAESSGNDLMDVFDLNTHADLAEVDEVPSIRESQPLRDQADQIHAMLNSGESDTVNMEPNSSSLHLTSDHPPVDADDTGVRIKKENQDFVMLSRALYPGEIIDISDDEDPIIKQERDPSPFGWKPMPSGTVLIVDSDDEDTVIKQESSPSPLRWSNIPNDTIFVIDSDDENPLLPPDKAPLMQSHSGNTCTSPITNEVEDEIIELMDYDEPNGELDLGEFLLKKKRDDGISLEAHQHDRVVADQGSAHDIQNSDMLADGLNDDSWMEIDADFDADAASKFQDLKCSYKEKCKADKNTLQDDYDFSRAEKMEKARLKRIKMEYLTSRGDVDEEDKSDISDEDELFVRQSQGQRRAAAGDKDDDYMPPQAKKRKPNLNLSSTEASADLDEDLKMNLLVGIENFVRTGHEEQNNDPITEQSHKDGKRRKNSAKTKRTEKGYNHTSSKKRWTEKDQPSGRRKKPTQAGFLNNAGSLLNSNIFDDANAIRGLAPLPVSTETKKSEVLKAMVANIPLGVTKFQIQQEKEHIKRATITLGKRRVNPSGKGDGKGEWSFKGMESSLRHHQVQGAAWMCDREFGDTQPLGGIQADAYV